MAVSDIYKLRVTSKNENSVFENILHFVQTEGSSESLFPQDICAAFEQLTIPAWLNCLSADANMLQLDCWAITGQPQALGSILYGNSPGTVTGEPSQANNAVCVTQYTDAPNGKHNGRIYFAGWPEQWAPWGTLDATGKAAFDLLMVELMKPLVVSGARTGTFQPCIASHYVDGVRRDDPVSYQVVSYVIRDEIKTQSRRTTDALGFAPGTVGPAASTQSENAAIYKR